ncbi:hypothetical protein BC827DRAFT_1159733, partial [Russula dissimulans]
ALGGDDTLEKFFAAVPGLFKSKLVKDLETHFTFALYARFWEALDGFLDRTLSSNSVKDSVKTHRLVICTNIMQLIPSPLPGEIFPSGATLSNAFNRIPPSIRMGQVLARWCKNHDERIAERARLGIVGILTNVEERDDRWVALAEGQLRLSKRALEDYVSHGDDSVSLAILTHVTRQAIRSDPRIWLDQLSLLTRFNIRNTLPELQNDFCASWNQIVLEARRQGYNSSPVEILYEIHHHYIAVHQGTDAALTAFTASTDDFHILWEPSSYPLCNIPSHRGRPSTPSRIHIPQILDVAHPIHVGHYFDVPPHPTAEPQPAPATGSSAGVRHADEPNIIPGHRSTDELSYSSPSTDLHPNTQVTPTIGPSAHESIEAISHDSNEARFSHPTAHLYTSERVESSYVPTDAFTFPQPNLVLTPVIPSASSYIPSFPVPDTRGAPDALQYLSLVPNTVSSSGRQYQQEVSPPWAARDVNRLQLIGDSLPHSFPNNEATSQSNNETTVVPPVVSGSPPSPSPRLALDSGVFPTELPSSASGVSDLIQADHVSHPQGILFSSLSTVPRRSHIPPHVTFVPDTHVPSGVGTVTEHDDTGDQGAPIEMEVFSLQLGTQRVPLVAGNVSSISQIEDRPSVSAFLPVLITIADG